MRKINKTRIKSITEKVKETEEDPRTKSNMDI